MDLIKSIIMGLVQGIAEFLPISSSGHLAIMKHILHMETDTGLLFDVLLHIGTLIAIFIAFWKDIQELIIEGFKLLGDIFINLGRLLMKRGSKKQVEYKTIISSPYRRFVILVLISCLPTGIMGFAFGDAIEVAGTSLLIPGICLIITGVLLQIADKSKTGKKDESSTSFKDAGLLGLAQGFAIVPGLSRSGTTITAGLLLGLDRNFAVKFSFIMSIPAVLGAALKEALDFSMDMVSQSDLINYLIGTIVAGVVGYISIKTMLVVVRGKKFTFFSLYCFILGFISVIGYFVV